MQQECPGSLNELASLPSQKFCRTAIIKIVRDLKQGCKCIPLRLGVLLVSLFVALGVNVGMKCTTPAPTEHPHPSPSPRATQEFFAASAGSCRPLAPLTSIGFWGRLPEKPPGEPKEAIELLCISVGFPSGFAKQPILVSSCSHPSPVKHLSSVSKKSMSDAPSECSASKAWRRGKPNISRPELCASTRPSV